MRNGRRGLAALVAVGLVATIAACSSGGGDDDTVDTSAPVTIKVQGLPVATDKANRAAFQKNVEQFEADNPNITVKATDEIYSSAAFTTQFAGGTAPTVIVVPFTEPAALIAREQVADISKEIADIGELDSLNPAALGVLKADDKLYGVPQNVYALGLVYNRELFTKAGLDPDKPPATWDEVRADAKAIKEKTGVAGFGSMTSNGTGGWQLTAQTVSSGDVIQKADGDKFTSTIDNPATRSILQWQHDLRFTDDSIGTNVLREQPDAEKAFASGQVGMIIATPSYYNRYIGQYAGKPADFGVTSMPQANDANKALIGGTAVMVTSTASAAERAAAVKWIYYEYVRPQLDTTAAANQAKANNADGIGVGVPLLPLFDDETQAKISAAIKPYVNIDLDHFAPYIDGVKKLTFVPEPSVATQQIYKSLDTVVQQVLTKPDADIDALLQKADKQAQSLIDQAG
ncbi:sugar ABC transporter substrate-binding protein [Luteimicrobium album]|uniref:Sugar ABC transporter substrate-binding protein n=1 Tax=Luteimicrobium album TaxID=1054550 RepID=A0ABQ6I1K6_9MICO|nr:extracellular solute-binding protein [Luteimicrobium album]GMA23670.1 sugar ABC transporter substrate-binding protein [Luteimicrobium album]